jgi:hypothetical protein
MHADQVNTLGGLCELIGVGFVTRDLMALARYRGILRQLAGRFHAWRRKALAAARRLLRRPGRSVTVHAQAASAVGITGNVTVRAFPGPFEGRAGQSLEDQVAALGRLVNRLREEVLKEPQERDRAITAEREARRQELRTEVERLERLIAEARQEVEQLREATTGDLGLRVESVAFLVGGVLLTAWPEWFADRWPGWPPFRVAAFFLGAYVVFRVFWARWLRPREGWRGSGLPRVGCGVLWYGPRTRP